MNKQMHYHCGRMRRLAAAVVALAMLTCAVGEIFKVGGKSGWIPNVNYTQWAATKPFYVGDWLYFEFDHRYYSVLEVNGSSYERCNDHEFVKNITGTIGRRMYYLREPRSYYFLSSGGYCFHGMKLSIDVSRRPPSKNHY